MAHALAALQAVCARVGEHFGPYAESAHSSLAGFACAAALCWQLFESSIVRLRFPSSGIVSTESN